MKIFNLDSPFFQFMEKVADFFIVNVLTVLLFIPVITGGAAITSAYKIMQNMLTQNDQPIFKTYFKTFAAEFKQSTIVWLLTLLVLALLVGNLFLVYINFSGHLGFFLYILLGVASIVFLGAATFAFPMIARYENTLKQHLRNALLLAIAHLPRTVIILALYAIPVALAIFNVGAFLNLSIIWILIGVSITVYLASKIIQPIFQKLEAAAEENTEDTEN